MVIIDAHAHISDTTYGNTEIYLKQLQQAGIDRGVVVPGGTMDVRKMTDYVTGKAKPENPIPDNHYVEVAFQAQPGIFWGFTCIDPHQADAVEVLEKSFQKGFRGLKLSPMTHQFSFSSKAVAALAACRRDYGYPVYSHVVYSPGASTARFVTLAREFPKTNFILGHMGFGPADREAAEAAAQLDNLFLETSTGNFLHIQEAIKKAGPGKIIFGSEFPLSHPGVELKKILLLDLGDEDREKVLGKNLMALLRLS